MTSTLKFSPPTWNSDKASPTWRDFCHQFESFVDYQKHGSVLLDLACKVLGKSRNFVASKHTQVDDAISYVLPDAHEADNNEGGDAAAAPAPERVVNSVADLTPEEVALDRSMHNILDNCVLGSKRTALTTIQTRSWIQAWVSLHREMGATTIKRKTVIIGDLIKMEFEPSPAKFKQATLDLVQRFYETNITMEELMMYCITQSFPEEYLSLKVMMSQRIEESKGTPSEVFDFITFTSNTMEMASSELESKKIRKIKTTPGRKACTRCGRDNHALARCRARYHVDGTLIDAPLPEKSFVAACQCSLRAQHAQAAHFSPIAPNFWAREPRSHRGYPESSHGHQHFPIRSSGLLLSGLRAC